MRHHSFSGVTVGEQQPLGQRKGSMAFKDLSATTIAEQLTFLEYRMLRRIPVRITHCWFIFFLGCFFFFFRNGTLPPGQSFWSRGQKLLRPKWAKCIPVSDQNSTKTQPMGQHIPIWLDSLLQLTDKENLAKSLKSRRLFTCTWCPTERQSALQIVKEDDYYMQNNTDQLPRVYLSLHCISLKVYIWNLDYQH